jgi:hypothetical protein
VDFEILLILRERLKFFDGGWIVIFVGEEDERLDL